MRRNLGNEVIKILIDIGAEASLINKMEVEEENESIRVPKVILVDANCKNCMKQVRQ